jgi:hypothetical protein
MQDLHSDVCEAAFVAGKEVAFASSDILVFG